MPAPVITFYEDGSTPSTGVVISLVDFGVVEKGITSPTITINIWNDRGGGDGSDTAISPRFYAISGPDDISDVFAGTAFNNFKSMLEARSCGSYGTPADQDQVWTPIGPAQYLLLGNMPSNSMREIELRLRVPTDAVAQVALKTAQYRLSL